MADVLTDFLNRNNQENGLKQQQNNQIQQSKDNNSLIASLALGSEQQDQPSISELIDQESQPQPQPDNTSDPIYTLEHDKDLMSMIDGSYIDNNPKLQINEQYQQAKKSLAEILQMPKFNPVSLDDGDSGYYIDENGQKRHFRMKGYDAIDGKIPDGYSKSQDRMDVQNVAAFYRTGTEPTIENTTDEAMTQMREPLKKEDTEKFANLIGANIDEKLNEDHSHNVIAQSKDIRYVVNDTGSKGRDLIELYDANTGKRINQAMHTDLNGYNINIDKFNKMYQKILDRQTDREEDESKSLLKYTAESVIDAFANTGLYLADKASNVLSDDIHKTVHKFAQKHQDMLTDGIEPKRLQAYDKEFEENKGILNKLGTVFTHPEETLSKLGTIAGEAAGAAIAGTALAPETATAETVALFGDLAASTVFTFSDAEKLQENFKKKNNRDMTTKEQLEYFGSMFVLNSIGARAAGKVFDGTIPKFILKKLSPEINKVSKKPLDKVLLKDIILSGKATVPSLALKIAKSSAEIGSYGAASNAIQQKFYDKKENIDINDVIDSAKGAMAQFLPMHTTTLFRLPAAIARQKSVKLKTNLINTALESMEPKERKTFIDSMNNFKEQMTANQNEKVNSILTDILRTEIQEKKQDTVNSPGSITFENKRTIINNALKHNFHKTIDFFDFDGINNDINMAKYLSEQEKQDAIKEANILKDTIDEFANKIQKKNYELSDADLVNINDSFKQLYSKIDKENIEDIQAPNMFLHNIVKNILIDNKENKDEVTAKLLGQDTYNAYMKSIEEINAVHNQFVKEEIKLKDKKPNQVGSKILIDKNGELIKTDYDAGSIYKTITDFLKKDELTQTEKDSVSFLINHNLIKKSIGETGQLRFAELLDGIKTKEEPRENQANTNKQNETTKEEAKQNNNEEYNQKSDNIFEEPNTEENTEQSYSSNREIQDEHFQDEEVDEDAVKAVKEISMFFTDYFDKDGNIRDDQKHNAEYVDIVWKKALEEKFKKLGKEVPEYYKKLDKDKILEIIKTCRK